MTATYETACKVARNNSRRTQTVWGVISDPDPWFAANGIHLGYNVREIDRDGDTFHIPSNIFAAFYKGKKVAP